jgi:cell division protein FtsZ
MDRGRLLADAEHVLVQVAGGPGMTLSEVEILMAELGKHVGDRTQILFGTGVDGRMGNRLSVTIISSLAAEEEIVSAPVAAEPKAKAKSRPPVNRTPAPTPVVPVQPEEPIEDFSPPPPIETQMPDPEPIAAPVSEQEEISDQPEEYSDEEESADESEFADEPELTDAEMMGESDLIPFEQPVVEPPPPRPLPSHSVIPVESALPQPKADPQPRLIVPKKKPVIPKEQKPEKIHAKQEILQFEPISRGRFEKSEPTIVEGQDLDVPTFLRKNIRVK